MSTLFGKNPAATGSSSRRQSERYPISINITQLKTKSGSSYKSVLYRREYYT